MSIHGTLQNCDNTTDSFLLSQVLHYIFILFQGQLAYILILVYYILIWIYLKFLFSMYQPPNVHVIVVINSSLITRNIIKKEVR